MEESTVVLNGHSELPAELEESDVSEEKSKKEGETIEEGYGDGSTEKETAEDGDSDLEKDDGWLRILGNDQLRKRVLQPGQEKCRPQRGNLCDMTLQGWLEDGTVFEPEKQLTIQLGDNELIQGLELTLPLMDVGETAEVIVAARFGFGAQGLDPGVPPGSELRYHVHLHSSQPGPEPDAMTVPDRKRVGNAKRSRGNWWFSRGEWSLAVQCYRRALDYLDDIPPELGDEPKEEDTTEAADALVDLIEDRLKVYNNLAAAQMKLDAHEAALRSVEAVLRCQPHNVKALFRKSKVLAAQGQTQEAVEAMTKALQAEPGSKVLQQELAVLKQCRKKEMMSESALYRRMLGQGKEKKDTKRAGQRSKLAMSVMAGLVVVIAAGVAAVKYRFY